MSFSYKRLTLASLGKVWNFFSGEFLQLFVHPGTQQLNLRILHLTTSTKTQGNEEFKQIASTKTAPWRFATPNLTQSPAQPRNGQYKSYWAAMNKIFIYACPCVNKMTWAFFLPGCKVVVFYAAVQFSFSLKYGRNQRRTAQLFYWHWPFRSWSNKQQK